MKQDKPRLDKRHGALLARVILAGIGLIFFCSAEGWGADWQLVCVRDGFSKFYDSESVTNLSEKAVRIWVETAYTEKGILDIVAKYGGVYKGLSYALTLYETDCENRTIRYLVDNYYSKEREVLKTFRDGPLHYIAPESVAEELYKIVCKGELKTKGNP